MLFATAGMPSANEDLAFAFDLSSYFAGRIVFDIPTLLLINNKIFCSSLIIFAPEALKYGCQPGTLD